MKNLIQGNKYLFTTIDSDDNKKEFIGEFRGYEFDEIYGLTLIIWEDGDSRGREYDECDVVRAVKK